MSKTFSVFFLHFAHLFVQMIKLVKVSLWENKKKD